MVQPLQQLRARERRSAVEQGRDKVEQQRRGELAHIHGASLRRDGKGQDKGRTNRRGDKTQTAPHKGIPELAHMGRHTKTRPPYNRLHRSRGQRTEQGNDTQALHRRRGASDGARMQIRLLPYHSGQGGHRQVNAIQRDGRRLVQRQRRDHGGHQGNGTTAWRMGHRTAGTGEHQEVGRGAGEGFHLKAGRHVPPRVRHGAGTAPQTMRILRNN